MTLILTIGEVGDVAEDQDCQRGSRTDSVKTRYTLRISSPPSPVATRRGQLGSV
jgi:hypothetical protein